MYLLKFHIEISAQTQKMCRFLGIALYSGGVDVAVVLQAGVLHLDGHLLALFCCGPVYLCEGRAGEWLALKRRKHLQDSNNSSSQRVVKPCALFTAVSVFAVRSTADKNTARS